MSPLAVQITRFDIEGPLLLTQPVFEDERGSFIEAYNKRAFSNVLADTQFVQDNISVSKKRGTIRGINFQCVPYEQAKLFRVLRGAVFDVAVDLRVGSATFTRHIANRLDATSGNAIFLPRGFAHGFCTLEDETHVQYKLDQYFSPEHCRTIRWCDPALGIAWPVTETEAIVLDRDRSAPLLSELLASR